MVAVARQRLYLPPGGRWPSEARSDEECGQKSYFFCVVAGFLRCPTSRRSSSVFFAPPSSGRKIHLPPGGRYAPSALKRAITPNFLNNFTKKCAWKLGNVPIANRLAMWYNTCIRSEYVYSTTIGIFRYKKEDNQQPSDARCGSVETCRNTSAVLPGGM